MSDPFSTKTDAVYVSVLAKDAQWKAGGTGAGVVCRIRFAQPDEVVNFGQSRAVMSAVLIRVRTADIAAPAEGDIVTVGTTDYRISGDPRYHGTRRLEWLCEAAQV